MYYYNTPQEAVRQTQNSYLAGGSSSSSGGPVHSHVCIELTQAREWPEELGEALDRFATST